MSTAKVTYLGGLRTQNQHIKSGGAYFTDAPVDNHGKGEAFSPTDTVATGLANCMLTVMGIKANQMEVNMEGSYAEVTKVMASDPRRISEIHVELHLPADLDDKTKTILQRTGETCPVHYSLHPDIHKVVNFHWDL